MKLSFFGADQCVTGSCHCLEINGKRILIDCGLQQGRDEVSNAEFPFAANTVDYVLVTHAHIDHSGRIPMLVKQGLAVRRLRLPASLLSGGALGEAAAGPGCPGTDRRDGSFRGGDPGGRESLPLPQ